VGKLFLPTPPPNKKLLPRRAQKTQIIKKLFSRPLRFSRLNHCFLQTLLKATHIIKALVFL
jgi:hypothetical protein